MSPRTKSILLLVATLIIGILLGALINGYFVRHRLERLGNLMTPGGFEGRLERVIQPVDDAQRDAVRAILQSAAPRATAIMRRSREDMRALNDSVKTQLGSILTDEQMARLDKALRFRGRDRFRGPRGPMRDDSTRRWRRGPRGRDGMPPPVAPPALLDGEQPPPPPPPPPGD